jgi:ATP-dependent Clp protease adaptor protein ClpS
MADQNKARYGSHGDLPSTFPAGETRPSVEWSGPRLLPPWRVVLHNDDVSGMDEVVEAIHRLTPLSRELALTRMREAHLTGAAMLLVTHRERAELYVEQFQSLSLTVTIEPAV